MKHAKHHRFVRKNFIFWYLSEGEKDYNQQMKKDMKNAVYFPFL